MSLIQRPEQREEKDLPVDQVLPMDEKTWYEKAYRGEDAPQLTVRALLMGSLLGFFLAFTNLYIGLKTGWHLGVAITASILSFSIWSALVRAGIAKSPMSILENNCMQSTASSAGYSTGGTLVSAFPALLLLTGAHPPLWVIATWVFFNAILGTTLAIPMKRNMINQERLKFPSGVAAAVTLQSLYSKGQEALLKARALFASAGIAALVPLVKDLGVRVVMSPKRHREALVPGASKIFDWLPGISVAGKRVALSDFNVKLDHGIVLVAAGGIIGLRATISMMIGAIALVWFVAPTALTSHWTNTAGLVVTAATKPASAWKEIGVWVGAPMMVTAGLFGFARQWRTIGRAVRGILSKNDSGDDLVARTEVPIRWFIIGAGISGTALALIAWRAFQIPPHLGILAVLMTFFLALVACRALGETDITPTGAMGKITQLTYGVIMPQSTTANLMTAAITSGAASASADLLNDLKSGYLLGANPRRQFIAQLSGILTGTIATVIGYYALVPDAMALTGKDGVDPKFAAPAAQQWKAVAEVFRVGIANMHPMARHAIFLGVAIGLALSLLETFLPPKAKRFLPSPTGVGLGFTLPFYYPLAMLLGAVIAAISHAVSKEKAERYTVPISSGLIAGESIVGVIVAILNNFVLK